ncbi:MAG: FMNH2-dependent alkanesulfonate monooxygenase [Campylobacteraceae bacterium]|jgi:alkanesulfonate monooxygenase|nr:FMNH2-dependent alkanesulfonate monooxygenase [Campylobacteraceae bacterium]
MSLSIFWLLPTGGDSRYLGKASAFRPISNAYLRQIATTAEQFGYDGLLIPTGSWNLDPFVTAATLAAVTSRIKLLVALRTSAVGNPTVFARATATLDEALNGRLILNVVPGAYEKELAAEGIRLSHDERYELADEFLTLWKRLLNGERVTHKGKYFDIEDAQNLFPPVQKPHPPLYFGGSSDAAHDLTAKHIDAYLSWGEPPHLVAEKIADVKKRAEKYGRKVRFGLRVNVIVRDTNEEAWAEANKLISHIDDETIAKAQRNFALIDSVGQKRLTSLHNGDKNKLEVSPNLWAGIGLVRRGAGTALVGDPKTVAARLQEYIDLGIDTFVLSGYPHLEEVSRFAELVFPLLPDKKPTSVPNDKIFAESVFSSHFENKEAV